MLIATIRYWQENNGNIDGLIGLRALKHNKQASNIQHCPKQNQTIYGHLCAQGLCVSTIQACSYSTRARFEPLTISCYNVLDRGLMHLTIHVTYKRQMMETTRKELDKASLIIGHSHSTQVCEGEGNEVSLDVWPQRV